MTDNPASSGNPASGTPASGSPDRIERTLEVLLYAPIGVGLFLKETAPTFVNMFVARGRAEIDRRQDEVQQRVTTARSLGQVAMAFGPPMVRQKVEQTVSEARRKAESVFGTPASSPSAPSASPGPAPDPAPDPAPSGDIVEPSPPTASAPIADLRGGTGPANNGDAVASAGLPIPGYDALSASQVVERLTGLAPEELDAVYQYEASHRQRRTILGKIEQLAG
jgi:hypothetical protein